MLLTIVVLISQNRRGHLSERRAHLDLQGDLQSEQKIAKLIFLLEELRRGQPTVKNRFDPDVEAMLQSADPHGVL